MVRPLRDDELERYNAKTGDYIIMAGPGPRETKIVSKAQLRKRYEMPKARHARND